MEVIGVEDAGGTGAQGVVRIMPGLCTMKAEPEGEGMPNPCARETKGGVMWLFTVSHQQAPFADTPYPLTILTLFPVPFTVLGQHLPLLGDYQRR